MRRIREASVADVPAIRAILAAHGEDGPVGTVDIVGPYLEHLIAHGRALVTVDGDAVIAYAAAIDAGVTVHLADLFVRPDLLGQGIGRPLLDEVFRGATRRTTFASSDPRALPVYVRAGMAPWWVTLYLEGDPGVLADPGLRVDAADAVRLSELERSWTGADRAADHAHWAGQPDADAFVVLDAGVPAAIGNGRARQVGSARALNRLVVAPDADPVPVILAAIRRAGRGGRVAVSVPGPNPALPVLLGAGFRIADRDQYMASEPGIVDPARLLPNGGLL